MMRLPEKIRRGLEKTVREMMLREDVYGIGSFGSWRRGDAAPTSDIDLLIIVKSNLPHQYVENHSQRFNDGFRVYP